MKVQYVQSDAVGMFLSTAYYNQNDRTWIVSFGVNFENTFGALRVRYQCLLVRSQCINGSASWKRKKMHLWFFKKYYKERIKKRTDRTIQPILKAFSFMRL